MHVSSRPVMAIPSEQSDSFYFGKPGRCASVLVYTVQLKTGTGIAPLVAASCARAVLDNFMAARPKNQFHRRTALGIARRALFWRATSKRGMPSRFYLITER